MIAAILMGLLKANLAAGGAVLAVLAARRVVRTRFGARAAYALWLAPLAAAVAVLLPHPQMVTPLARGAQAAVAGVAEAFVAQAPAAAWRAGPDLAALLFGLWLVGALAVAALVLRRQSRFIAAMGRLTPCAAPDVFRAESPHVGPAVVGVWRPRIVAPSDFETRFAPAERRLILAHEQAHLRTGDAGVNALACALQCVAWFNPLVHLGVRALRVDQELACDAAVIGAFPAARRAYAELLLKTQTVTQPLPLGCHWPAGAEHPLKERIAMLKSPLPAGPRRAVGLAAALALTLGVGGLAWSAQPQTASLEPAHIAQPRLTPVGYAPGGYTPPPGFAEPRVNGKAPQPPFHSIWLKKPTGADLVALYPAQAVARKLTADVLMSCKAGADGRLNGCKILHATVSGASGPAPDADPGFAAATLELAKLFQLEPTNSSGGSTDGAVIRIPVKFRLPNPPQPARPS